MTITAAFSTKAGPPRVHGRVRKFIGSALKGPLTLAGLALVATFAIEYQNAKELAEDAKGDKKRVLVLPFHRMKLVENKRPSFSATLDSLSASDSGDESVMEVRHWFMYRTIRLRGKRGVQYLCFSLNV